MNKCIVKVSTLWLNGGINVCRRRLTVMSGIQPTGVPHIGNYLGPMRDWVKMLNNDKSTNIEHMFLSIVDLHSLTVLNKLDNRKMTDDILLMAASLIAIGLPIDRVSIFQQSKIMQHTLLAWILMCLCPLNKVTHLPQWKEKSEARQMDNTGLLMYPVLQAADILLYRPHLVPVGEDQTIHVELARYLRNKLLSLTDENESKIIAEYFPLLEIKICQFPKIRSLTKERTKMSKSDPDVNSRIELTDNADVIRNKIRKAVTDSVSRHITYDPIDRPALANLINIYAALKDQTCEDVLPEIGSLSKIEFKDLLSETLIHVIDPIRLKINRLIDDRMEIHRLLLKGQEAAMTKASESMNILLKYFGMEMCENDSDLSRVFRRF